MSGVETGIAGRGRTAVTGHGDEANARIGMIAGNLARAIGRAIIDDDNLHAHSTLGQGTVDGARKRVLRIIGSDDETDIGDEIRHCGAFSRFPYCSISRTPKRPLTTPACMM